MKIKKLHSLKTEPHGPEHNKIRSYREILF